MKEIVFKCLFCELEGDTTATNWYKIYHTHLYICEDCRRKLMTSFPPQDIDKLTHKINGSGKYIHEHTRFGEIMSYLEKEDK